MMNIFIAFSTLFIEMRLSSSPTFLVDKNKPNSNNAPEKVIKIIILVNPLNQEDGSYG